MPVDPAILRALEGTKIVDITTIGRKSGKPRRIEIWTHMRDGKLYITGPPGKRDWYANMLKNQEMTLHVKKKAKADLPARARPILEKKERLAVLSKFTDNELGDGPVKKWIKSCPLVEVVLLGR
ncbi:MAG: DUF385 domain-containing protein [Chloroflexi bacterium]|nr:DUF385 domain-containing protein [Chloroflexota bacterium]